jgi:hypothetical protein
VSVLFRAMGPGRKQVGMDGAVQGMGFRLNYVSGSPRLDYSPNSQTQPRSSASEGWGWAGNLHFNGLPNSEAEQVQDLEQYSKI